MRHVQRQVKPFAIAAALSALLFLVVAVTWVRSYPHAGQIKSVQVRESAEDHVTVAADSVQASRGTIWVGRCVTRVSVAPGMPLKIVGDRGRVEEAAGNLDIFSVLDTVQPQPWLLLGAGLVTGSASLEGDKAEGPGWEGMDVVVMETELHGVLVPCWLLMLLLLVLPAWWFIRRKLAMTADA